MLSVNQDTNPRENFGNFICGIAIQRCDIAVAKWSNATVSARIYRVLSAMDDAAA